MSLLSGCEGHLQNGKGEVRGQRCRIRSTIRALELNSACQAWVASPEPSPWLCVLKCHLQYKWVTAKIICPAIFQLHNGAKINFEL